MSKCVVYYSSATSDLTVKKHQTSLKNLLDNKKTQYEERDLAQMDKTTRDQVYANAGSKVIPLVFVNDKYVGDYEALQGLEEDEKLDEVLRG